MAATCHHDACTCSVQTDGQFCSPECQEFSGNGDHVCHCGHEGCAGDFEQSEEALGTDLT